MHDPKRSLKVTGGMYGFHNNLRHCLASLAHGNEIKLKSGHTLVIPEDFDEPGFKAIRSQSGKPDEEIVFQIGSDTAWMMLIDHAKKMTKEESISMMFSYVDVKLPGSYQNRKSP